LKVEKPPGRRPYQGDHDQPSFLRQRKEDAIVARVLDRSVVFDRPQPKRTGRWSEQWLRELDKIIITISDMPDAQASETRRVLAKDPIAFAVIYLSHHLKDDEGKVTFSEVHFAWAEIAMTWAAERCEPMENRHMIISPRESGKSTWWFLIFVLWAAANGYSEFTAAFAHASSQAETHLLSVRQEFTMNTLLKMDFTKLCTPTKRSSGGSIADRAGMIHMANGFVLLAKGIDTAMLGMKVGSKRPDLLILDDIEPDEANYSADQAQKRLSTVTDAIFPLNVRARVVGVGTVTMPGSIMHQAVKAAKNVDVADWIADEKIKCHYFAPITIADDGEEQSVWPAKWSLDFLKSIRHTRSYAKNYENDPMAREGVYWLREDFRYGDLSGCTKTALFVDPAVTTRKTSDYSGLSVISFRPAVTELIETGRFDPVSNMPLMRRKVIRPSQCVIRYSVGVKLTGRHLRQFVIERVLPQFPAIKLIRVESNQGGDLWQDVFAGIPGVRYHQFNSTASKEVRFAEALELWQEQRVYHRQRFDALEEQAVGFPNSPHDDVIDAAVQGVRFFLLSSKAVPARVESEDYL
jgi:hypothetical protein